MEPGVDPRDRVPEFERHSPEEEFRIYADNELNRLRTSDEAFDEALYREAMELVLERLRKG
jgi:hypothetical protein